MPTCLQFSLYKLNGNAVKTRQGPILEHEVKDAIFLKNGNIKSKEGQN